MTEQTHVLHEGLNITTQTKYGTRVVLDLSCNVLNGVVGLGRKGDDLLHLTEKHSAQEAR